MTFEIIQDLCESQLFKSRQAVEVLTQRQLSERLLLYFCTLRILFQEKGIQRQWARAYCEKTVQWKNFDDWHTTGNDLYVLLLRAFEKEKKWDLLLSRPLVLDFLRDMGKNQYRDYVMRRLFMRLDQDLRISNQHYRAVRRLSMNWNKIDDDKKALVITRLYQWFSQFLRQSELLPRLRLMKQDGYWVNDLEDLILIEDEGSTTSADIASIPTPLLKKPIVRNS